MAVSNGLDPNFESIGLNIGPKIYGGASGTTTTIEAEVGADAISCGSIYISTSGSGMVWVLIQGDGGDGHNVWTRLTIN